jgi:hypothetical protein
MLRAWWQANMDARRSISLLLSVAGLTVVGIATSASPVSLAFDNPPYGAGLVGAFLGAAIGGHFRHRVSDPERALLWALANGASLAAILIAAFVTLVVIRPTLRGIPGLEDAWGGVLVSGLLVAYVGAFLWERDARRRRFGGWRSLLPGSSPSGSSRGRAETRGQRSRRQSPSAASACSSSRPWRSW